MPIQEIVMASDACARLRHTVLAPFASRPTVSWRLCQFSVVGKPAVLLGTTQRCFSEGSASEAIEGSSACDAHGGRGQPQTPAALLLNATIFPQCSGGAPCPRHWEGWGEKPRRGLHHETWRSAGVAAALDEASEPAKKILRFSGSTELNILFVWSFRP